MINIRERDRIWSGPPNPIASDTKARDISLSPTNVSLPHPFPSLVTIELTPGEPAPDEPPGPTPPPPPPGFFWNEAFWVTAYCDDSTPVNSVSFYVPAGVFMASTQEAANNLASAHYLALCQAQLNCSNVSLLSLPASADSYEVLSFDQQQFGGYWFSDPQPFLADGFYVNIA